MIQKNSTATLVALRSLLIAEVLLIPALRTELVDRRGFDPSVARRIERAAAVTRMAAPFQGAVPPEIKVEDEEDNVVSVQQVPSEQEVMEMFRKGVQRRVELKKKGLLSASGGSHPLPPPPTPPVQPPLPPPPAPAPAWAKRQAPGPPPGFAGVRQPPLKQYQRRQQKAPAAAQAQHAPQPAPIAIARHAPAGPSACPPPPPVHAIASPGAVPPASTNANANAANKPALQRRSSAPKPRHPAANKLPTVPCQLCGVLCLTARHLRQHQLGRKRRNRAAYLAGQVNVRCEVCGVHLSSGLNVEQHNAGKQHLRRLQMVTL